MSAFDPPPLIIKCAELDDKVFSHQVFSTLCMQEWSLCYEWSMSGHSPSMEIDERARVVVFVVPQKMSSVKRYSKILIIYLAVVVLEFWRPGQNREIIEDVFEDYYGTRFDPSEVTIYSS